MFYPAFACLSIGLSRQLYVTTIDRMFMKIFMKPVCLDKEDKMPINLADLHCVRRVSVVEDHRLVYVLVVTLQFVHVRSERRDLLVEGVQPRQVVLEFAPLHADSGDGVQMALDPLADDVRLLSESATQTLVVLLSHQLVAQHHVAVGYQLLHLVPLVRQILHHTQSANSPFSPRDVRCREMFGDNIVVVVYLH